MSLPIPPHQDSLGTECVPPSMTAFSITKTSSMSSLIQLASASLHLTWIRPSCREPEMKLTLTVHSSVLPQNFNHNWKLSFTIQSNNHKFQGLKHGLLFWNVAYCYFYVCVCPCLLDCIYSCTSLVPIEARRKYGIHWNCLVESLLLWVLGTK